jgi:aryl-alcohol dehydrogenase-like predicted oxidoreductase
VSTIIAGTTRPEQVEANARAGEWHLAPDDLRANERVLSASE